MSLEQQIGEIVRSVVREELSSAAGYGDDQLMDADQVAEFLRLPSRHAVYALRRAGKLKSVALGDKTVRFRRGVVRSFIQERES